MYENYLDWLEETNRSNEMLEKVGQRKRGDTKQSMQGLFNIATAGGMGALSAGAFKKALSKSTKYWPKRFALGAGGGLLGVGAIAHGLSARDIIKDQRKRYKKGD